MKLIKCFLFVFFTTQYIIAQSITIGTGATIYVGSGADICAGGYGNITGNLIGQGTQCEIPIATLTFPLTVAIHDRWNLVSIPGLHPADQNIDTWWPFRDMNANVYRYSSGYEIVNMVIPGVGYWMKHIGDRVYSTGDEWPAGGIQIVPNDPINVAAGWNMIGGYENVVDVMSLTTTPPDQINYPIYKYVPGIGYQTATTLDPGYGYWTRVTSGCQIIIPEAPTKGTKKVVSLFQNDWGRITLTDAAEKSYTLYAVKGQVDLNKYELPPLPPAGLFDVRYSSGRVAEDINSSVQSIDMRGIIYPVKVRVEGMDLRLRDATGKEINTNIKSGEEITVNNPAIKKLMVSGQLIPDKYSIEQNYPNPFNPTTTIKFSIPKETQVNLDVHNILGEKVKELKNEVMKAGYYEVNFNATALASGIYFYRIKAGDFVQTKKMILLK